MSGFAFDAPAAIRVEWGGAARLGALLVETGVAAPGDAVPLVADPGGPALGLVAPAPADLAAAGLRATLVDAVEPDPKARSALEAAAAARAAGPRAVVAFGGGFGFGGGSALDVAKAAALAAGSDQPLEELYGVGPARGPRLELAPVPTTAGTGSEVAMVPILTAAEREKKGIVSPRLLPDLALPDAGLTLGLPPAIAAATGIDAMLHAIEAFPSRSPDADPVGRMPAGQALELLGANIRRAVFDGSDRAAREAMPLGSMLAGQAFANAPAAAVHAPAYPVGALFKVPRGLSTALAPAEVIRFDAPACGQDCAALAPRIFPDIDRAQGEEALAAELIARLAGLAADLGLTGGLRGVGIAGADVPRLAADAMNQTRLLVNNPREVAEAAARAIYAASL